MLKPDLNFAVSGDNKQYGSEQDWTKLIKDLMPIDLNRVTLANGKITYKDFSTDPKVDINVHDINGHIDNLRNSDAAGDSLPSPLYFSAISLGNGKVIVKGRINILRPFPDMDLDAALEKASLSALNSFPQAYAAVSFRRGTLDFYVHLKVINNQVSGYIKPIATDLSVDIFKSSNPIIVAWNAVIAGIAEILTNHVKDQFATKASLDGDLKTISPDGWEALVGIFRNAFVEAFNKGFSDLQPSASVPNKTPTP